MKLNKFITFIYFILRRQIIKIVSSKSIRKIEEAMPLKSFFILFQYFYWLLRYNDSNFSIALNPEQKL